MSSLTGRYRLKLLLSIFMILIGGTSLSAQFSIGAKVSYYLSMTQARELAYDDEQDFLSHKIRFIEEDVSPVPELFVNFNTDLVYVKTAVAYRRFNTRFSYRDFRDYDKQNYQTEIKESNTLLIPLEAGLIFENMRFGAGPSLSWTLAENTVFEGITELEERRSIFSSGYHLSFSITLNRLMFEILYEQRFHGVADYIYYRGDSQAFQQQARYISLGLAYTLEFN